VIDARSDIYSISIVLYQMLTGRLPFEATESNVVSVIYQHLEKAPPPPRSFNPALPEAVEEVVLRGLQKDPVNRYPSIEAMVDDLNRAAGRRTSTTTAPPVRLARSQPGQSTPAEQATTASYLPPVPPVPPPDKQAPPAPDPASAGANRTPPPTAISAAGRLRVPLILLIAFGLAGILIALVVLFSLSQSRRPAPPSFVVLEEETGSAELAVPRADEIAAARSAVGSGGFIAYLACVRTTEYHAAQAREMGDLAAEYGIVYRVYDADNDPYRQLTQIEQARADGASALILCPLDIHLLNEPLSAVEAAHVPLVILSSGIENYGGVLLGGDDYQMGLTAGRAAGQIAPSAVGPDLRAVVLGFPELAVLVERARGLVDGLLEVVPTAEIVAERSGGTRENGYQSIQQALADGLTFNVILSINDAGAYGAVEALREAGIGPEAVVISSVDAETLARQYIRDGYYFRASVIIDRLAFSRAAINAAVRLLAGATLPETLLVPPGPALTRAQLLDTVEMRDPAP
jgi:ABC-type sugar transport system substrate-binding protein